MTRRGGMSVMVVVPAFTERQQRYPPAIARVVTGFESCFSPQVCSRIDEPCRMQAQRNAEEYSPKHYTPTSKGKEHRPDYNERNIVGAVQPTIVAILYQIRRVACDGSLVVILGCAP